MANPRYYGPEKAQRISMREAFSLYGQGLHSVCRLMEDFRLKAHGMVISDGPKGRVLGILRQGAVWRFAILRMALTDTPKSIDFACLRAKLWMLNNQ